MQNKVAITAVSALAVTAMGLVGWQSWNTHQLQQQVVALQQQLVVQNNAPSVVAQSGNMQLSPTPNLQSNPPPANSQQPGALSPGTVQPLPINPPTSQSQAPRNPLAAADPFWGGQDPFAEMENMQRQMHQRMQDLMSGFGFDKPGDSLFDMDLSKSGLGFGSSMGFGDDPKFNFKENADNYQVTIAIPKDSKVEIKTGVQGRDLTVEGKVTVEQKNQQQGNSFQSRQTRQFARTFNLPDDVDEQGIRTDTAEDQVVLTLPKTAQGRQANSSGKHSRSLL